MSRVREFVRELMESFLRNLPLDLAAQLAYFGMLTIFPGAMFLLTVIGYLPLRGLEEEVGKSLYAVLPEQVAQLVVTTVHEIVGHQRGWLLLSTLLFAIWTGSDVASGLITALNRAYRVSETRSFLRVRGRAVLVTIGAGIQMFVAAVAMFIGPDIVHSAMAFLGLGGAFDHVWALVRWPVALLALMLMMASAYYFLPNVRQRWRFFTPGSTVAVLAWLALSMGFRVWVTHFPTTSKTYGALGTVVLLLMWLYWSAVMMILGGEINAIVDRMRGVRHQVVQPHRPSPLTPEPA